MKVILILLLLLQVGCATKYVLPGNRFITPESQGGVFRGQFELQQTKANQLTIDTTNSSVNDGVIYSDLNRVGFLYSTSLMESFDFFWSHTGNANSMLGGKLQLLGGSRSAKAVGNKLAIGAAFGGNEHETEDKKVEFELSGQELLLIYGYRFSENVLAYSSYSYATYHFTGVLNSSVVALNGAKPDYRTRVQSLSLGTELALEILILKLEGTYQQLRTDKTRDKENLSIGYSVGFQW